MSTNCVGLVSSIVYSVLARKDLRVAESFRRQFEEPVSVEIADQIQAHNEFWRQRFGACSSCVDSMAARRALESCDLDNWIRLFATVVVPRIEKLRVLG